MLFVHENNINRKIRDDYKKIGSEIQQFKNEQYKPVQKALLGLDFFEGNDESFEVAADICSKYCQKIEQFSKQNKIMSQSKFLSTFLEEISVYLFRNLPAIAEGKFNIFNKGIYAGMKISGEDDISIIKKDVDFCIGKKINISIDDSYKENIILPVVAVEVKTYLDATMFGEIKSSSKAIRSATPMAETYVLMGYKDLADEHIVAAKQDSALTELFALRKSKESPIEGSALYQYWAEIKRATENIEGNTTVPKIGRLMHL